MAFPAAVTLSDNFNRANENPLAGDWSNVFNLAVISNAMESLDNDNAAIFTRESYGPSIQQYFQMLYAGHYEFYFKIPISLVDLHPCYYIAVLPGSYLRFYRLDGEDLDVQLGADVTDPLFAANDYVGIEYTAATGRFEAFRSTNGVDWTSVGYRTDLTYAANVGYMGIYIIYAGRRADNFYAGTVSAGGVSITPPVGSVTLSGIAGRLDSGILVPSMIREN